MNELAALKENALPALRRRGLVAISVRARGPEHAFSLAKTMGWSEEECFAAEALASVYFKKGNKAYQKFIQTSAPGIFNDICTNPHHRWQPQKCNFPARVCLCSCHTCAGCKELDVVRGKCGCACHGRFCDQCHPWHDRRHREIRARKNYRRKYKRYRGSDDYDEDDELEESYAGNEISADEEPDVRGVTSSSKSAHKQPLQSPKLTPYKKLQRIVCKMNRVTGTEYSASLAESISGDKLQGLAHPDGNITITRELAEILSEDELAFVVGHEFGHQLKEHHASTEEVIKNEIEKIKQDGSATYDSMKGNGYGFFKRTLVTGAVVFLECQVARASVSATCREHECEADYEAIELMRQAGYKPESAVSAYKKLHHGRIPHAGFMDEVRNSLRGTHPLPEDRVKILEELTK